MKKYHKSVRFSVLALSFFILFCYIVCHKANIWGGHSILSNWSSLSTLNSTANNPLISRDKRANAIFTIFAYHIRPGCASAEVHSVIPETSWLKAEDISTVGDFAGWLPIEHGSNTVYYLKLFSSDKVKTEQNWTICFSLKRSNQTSEDALAFFKGSNAKNDPPKLGEFALFFPYGSNKPMHIEIYSEKGMQVYNR